MLKHNCELNFEHHFGANFLGERARRPKSYKKAGPGPNCLERPEGLSHKKAHIQRMLVLNVEHENKPSTGFR